MTSVVLSLRSRDRRRLDLRSHSSSKLWYLVHLLMPIHVALYCVSKNQFLCSRDSSTFLAATIPCSASTTERVSIIRHWSNYGKSGWSTLSVLLECGRKGQKGSLDLELLSERC